jgi:oligoribonuclease NrnB/cAMP/cGMP phosphodiesterase (DHH superfamily)
MGASEMTAEQARDYIKESKAGGMPEKTLRKIMQLALTRHGNLSEGAKAVYREYLK